MATAEPEQFIEEEQEVNEEPEEIDIVAIVADGDLYRVTMAVEEGADVDMRTSREYPSMSAL